MLAAVGAPSSTHTYTHLERHLVRAGVLWGPGLVHLERPDGDALWRDEGRPVPVDGKVAIPLHPKLVGVDLGREELILLQDESRAEAICVRGVADGAEQSDEVRDTYVRTYVRKYTRA
jgi:hypothetical protein